jgi:geranylgeranyl reductase family protein
MMYDVIVVGAGPAGSTAAYFLVEAGKRVLLIEKDQMPRYKMCGGGLSIRFLRQQFPFSFDNSAFHAVKGISYIHNGHVITIPLAADAVSLVMRDEFDHYLLSQTRADVIQGCAVRSIKELPNSVVVEMKDGSQYSAPFLIGADGANSIVARALGLRKRRVMAAAIEVELPASPEMQRRFGQEIVFIFGEIHYGYLWIFPKPNHLSIGIGALHPKPGELQATLKRVMARYGISLENVPLRGHPIPIFTRFERVASRRVLLAGDAAGLADPLSGEGIRFAIKSGRLAAESILRGQPQHYARDLFWSIGLNHRLTMAISILFYLYQFPFLFLGTPNPFSTQAVVEMLADRKTAFRFILDGLMTLPIFLSTEVTARLFEHFGSSNLASKIRAAVYPKDVSAPRRQAVTMACALSEGQLLE